MNRPQHFADAEYLLDGFAHVETSDEFRARLRLGRPLNVKLGIDPTSPDLHLGFMVVLHALQRFAESGHAVTLIIGDFTARIGDPSGKKVTRPQLTGDEIEANMQTYRQQASSVLDLERITIRYNSEWLGALSVEELVTLAGKTTVAQMLERNDFRDRYESGDPISLHELLYPVAMAYDSIVVKADVELGGVDQLFNLLMGRHYQRELGQPPQICAMVPLLVGLDGVQKMSKSLGNYVGVTEPAQTQFGKLMSLPDALIPTYARYAAFRSEADVQQLQADLQNDRLSPMEAKKRITQEIVARYHGIEAAKAAGEYFERTVQRKEFPDDAPESIVDTSTPLISSVLVASGLAASKREAERLIKGGGVRIDGAVIRDPNAEWQWWAEPVRVSIGARRFARVNARLSP
ncbi:MAG TPA: tyrosine--tRNA ligase [Candidatus Dormibacteraeota bacterium]|nr:tyrosine--tRNA ligase [Candidatus Dormibacteraeota bacterium]